MTTFPNKHLLPKRTILERYPIRDLEIHIIQVTSGSFIHIEWEVYQCENGTFVPTENIEAQASLTKVPKKIDYSDYNYPSIKDALISVLRVLPRHI